MTRHAQTHEQERAASADAGGRAPVFPWVPAAVFLVTVGLVATLLLLPPWLKARRLARAGRRPTWFGYAFLGRCLLTARLQGPGEGAASDAGAARLLLRIDNSRGCVPVRVDARQARWHEINGPSIGGRVAGGALLAGLTAMAPGAAPQQDMILFEREQVKARLERLRFLRLRVNGRVLNLPGLPYGDPAMADRMQTEFERRVLLFPPRAGQEAGTALSESTPPAGK